MKKITLVFSCLLSSLAFAQSQFGNGSLEQWQNVGAPTEEPFNWNSFKTGSGPFSGFANKQIERSTNVRAGSSGMYCARIWSTSVLGIVANGTMTSGRINMGSTSPANSANYNYSQTSDTLFSEACLANPDSIVFWAKYTHAGAGVDQTARVHAIVHDSYDVRDPIDPNSYPHVISEAELNFSPTNGDWVRFSVPFVPSVNTGLSPAYILTTFATNSIPGGGATNDEVLLDDISLVYNGGGAGLDDPMPSTFAVTYSEGLLHVHGEVQGHLRVIGLNGQVVYEAAAKELISMPLTPGFYVAHITGKGGKYLVTKFSVN